MTKKVIKLDSVGNSVALINKTVKDWQWKAKTVQPRMFEMYLNTGRILAQAATTLEGDKYTEYWQGLFGDAFAKSSASTIKWFAVEYDKKDSPLRKWYDDNKPKSSNPMRLRSAYAQYCKGKDTPTPAQVQEDVNKKAQAFMVELQADRKALQAKKAAEKDDTKAAEIQAKLDANLVDLNKAKKAAEKRTGDDAPSRNSADTTSKFTEGEALKAYMKACNDIITNCHKLSDTAYAEIMRVNANMADTLIDKRKVA